MKKSKFSEEQIARILKEVEAGAKFAETCRKHGMSEPTYYAWKARYAGMDVSQLRRLKELESENAKLKKMYAELALVHHAPQDVVCPGAASGACRSVCATRCWGRMLRITPGLLISWRTACGRGDVSAPST